MPPIYIFSEVTQNCSETEDAGKFPPDIYNETFTEVYPIWTDTKNNFNIVCYGIEVIITWTQYKEKDTLL